MALYKRGRIWWISMWRHGHHIQKSTGLESYRDAKVVESAMSLAKAGTSKTIVAGLLSAVYGGDVGRPRVKDLWTEYLDVLATRGAEISRKSMADKLSSVTAMSRWAATSYGAEFADEITGQVAREYASSLIGKCSEKRRLNILASISSVWNAVAGNHPDLGNPWKGVIPRAKESTVHVGFTQDEERRVMDAALSVHPQWYMACMISRHTGLRYRDVCTLKWSSVNLETWTISVVPAKTKAHGISVEVPMSGPLEASFRDYLRMVPGTDPDDSVLPWMDCVGRKGLHNFRSVLERAGLGGRGFTFHDLRHTFATRLAEAGVGADVRKKLLGHRTDAMADHYNHYGYRDEMKAAVEAAAASA